jgi:hypothetical protein
MAPVPAILRHINYPASVECRHFDNRGSSEITCSTGGRRVELGGRSVEIFLSIYIGDVRLNKNQKTAFIIVGWGLVLSIFIHFGIMFDLIPLEPKYILYTNLLLIAPLLFTAWFLKDVGLETHINNTFKTALKVLPLWLTIGLGVILVYSVLVFINYTYVNKPLADRPDMDKVLTKLNKGASAATMFFYAAAFGLLNLRRKVKKTAKEAEPIKSQADAAKQGRMEQVYKDETRWLTRMLAVLFVLLGIQGVVTQYQRVSVDHNSISFIALGMIILSFFLGYRLWSCSSIWNLFFWFFGESLVVLQLHSQYCRINKHIRAGWVAGTILPVMCIPLLMVFSRYKGVWFWESVKKSFYIILLPLKSFLQMLSDSLPSYVLFAFVVSYVFIIGFVLGISISVSRHHKWDRWVE